MASAGKGTAFDNVPTSFMTHRSCFCSAAPVLYGDIQPSEPLSQFGNIWLNHSAYYLKIHSYSITRTHIKLQLNKVWQWVRKLRLDKNWKTLSTCHHLLGFIWLHVAIILSCHFFRTGLSAASLLSIERVCIVFKDNELQKKKKKRRQERWDGGRVAQKQQGEFILLLRWTLQYNMG